MVSDRKTYFHQYAQDNKRRRNDLRNLRRAQQRREREAERAQKKDDQLPFVGVDGEGANLPNGYHAYFLLRAGESYVCARGDAVRLTTQRCLDFLADLHPDAIYVAYFFDYDVTKILEDLPAEKLRRLMDRNLRRRIDGRGVFPVSYGEFELDYLPRKEFKVRRRVGRERDDTRKSGYRDIFAPWVVINDVGSFFQTRFVSAIEKWGIGDSDTRRAIGVGKEQRAEFDVADFDEIAEYNRLECVCLAELMEQFREACQHAGYVPAKWQGPGQLAEAAFRRHGVTESRKLALFNSAVYKGLLQFAQRAFYGGRPELSVIGPVNQRVEQWDINSAYPYAMTFLPCLEHGVWTYATGNDRIPIPTADFDRRDNYALVYGSFEPNNSRIPYWFGLPVRNKDGGIAYPGSGRGWYWNFEVDASIHQQFTVEEIWTYRRTCDCVPLEFVRPLYLERLSLGKDGPGIVLKLLLNSLYGKTVQSIGSPKYSNPIWGSFITSFCRTMIQSFIHTSPICQGKSKGRCGSDIIMIATDSVCTLTKRTDIEDTKELGGWSLEVHPEGMFLIQPGLYFGTSGKPAKTRGVPQSVIVKQESEFRSAFDRMAKSKRLEDGDVQVPQRMFVGIRLALARRNTKLLGQWIEFEDPETGRKGKTIKFDWLSKRAPHPALMPVEGVRSYIATFPIAGDPSVETVPYSRDIGALQLAEEYRSWLEAQPDWSEGMVVEE